MAAIRYSENDKGKRTNLLRPSRPACVRKPAFFSAPQFIADVHPWRSASVEVSHHLPSLLGRLGNSVYRLHRIRSALFGFQWTPVFLWLATRISSGFRPCSGLGWNRSRNAVWLSARSDEIPPPCSPCRCAKVVLLLMEIAWQRLHFVYHPGDALNSGSELSSFAFSWIMRLFTVRPANIKTMRSVIRTHKQLEGVM